MIRCFRWSEKHDTSSLIVFSSERHNAVLVRAVIPAHGFLHVMQFTSDFVKLCPPGAATSIFFRRFRLDGTWNFQGLQEDMRKSSWFSLVPGGM